jgi:SAM-dependent methyltransferase
MRENTTDEAESAFARGRDLDASGDARAATAAYLMAFALAPDVDTYRRVAFARLNVMTGYRALPAPLLLALGRVAEREACNIQPLAMVVRNLIVAEERLPRLCASLRDDEDAETALAAAGWLMDDAIVLGMLQHAVNVSLTLETALVALRRHLSLAVASGRPTLLLAKFARFTRALAAQAITNGHVWPETPAESRALSELAHRRDSAALMVRAAYRPLEDISIGDAAALPEPLRQLRAEVEDERRRRASLRHVTSVAAGLSQAMQAQYEAYPYPRWRQLEIGERASLRALLGTKLPEAVTDRIPPSPYDILVAGCGTGHPALSLALGVADAEVLAVDLSRASLAYAQRMTAKLGATNISFAVADILNLGSLERRFDLIDCSGVLHHMSEPSQGLAVLRGLLKDSGVMLVSLYSSRGRRAEAAARALIKEQGFPDTLAGLRRARAVLIALPPDHPARAVTDNVEFFSRDGFHDLVFNIHESCTNPSAMKRLLEAQGLVPVAVDLPAALGAAEFRRRHKNPDDWADLDLWDTFEAEQPDVFAHMIKVWCAAA